MTATHRRDPYYLIVNNNAPELDRAATGLLATRQGLYVRQFIIQEGPLARAIRRLRIPLLSRRCRKLNIARHKIAARGFLPDLVNALGERLGRRWPSLYSHNTRQLLVNRAAAAVTRYAARRAPRADVLLANYLVAGDAFERTRGLCVLNYPIAHHRFQEAFFAAEAQKHPKFRASMPDWTDRPESYKAHLDREIELADLILLGSEFARRSFVESGVPADKLTVVPYGFDASAFQPPASRPDTTGRPLRLLFVGQKGYRKGLKYLFDALANIGIDYELTLCGSWSGDNRPYLDYGIPFQDLGHLPGGEVARCMQAADAFVFPTLIEGMGISPLEAMACGLPVITTTCGPDQIVRDGIDGIVCPPCDAEAIRQAIRRLHGDPEERRRMGANAAERARKFTWDVYEQSVQATLRALVQAKS